MSDERARPNGQDDERFLSATYPAHLGRPCVAAAGAVMVHYAYRLQSSGQCDEANASSRFHKCTPEEVGGLDDHVGDAILSRYYAYAAVKFGDGKLRMAATPT